jgi:hypothetical protein
MKKLGKETIRVGRNVDLLELEKNIKRANPH